MIEMKMKAKNTIMIEIMPKMTMNIATTATAMIVRSLAVTKRLSAEWN
jgi:hypothetical protein